MLSESREQCTPSQHKNNICKVRRNPKLTLIHYSFPFQALIDWYCTLEWPSSTAPPQFTAVTFPAQFHCHYHLLLPMAFSLIVSFPNPYHHHHHLIIPSTKPSSSTVLLPTLEPWLSNGWLRFCPSYWFQKNSCQAQDANSTPLWAYSIPQRLANWFERPDIWAPWWGIISASNLR